jgi:hypothetical protein
MIETAVLAPGTIQLTLPEKVAPGDFEALATRIDPVIREHGEINVLIDATKFHGWENTSAFERHAQFVREHEHNISRLALVVGHEWQKGLAAVISSFVHPAVKAFDHIDEARAWLTFDPQTVECDLDFVTHTWTTANPASSKHLSEGEFPLVRTAGGKRYELYSNGTFAEVEP